MHWLFFMKKIAINDRISYIKAKEIPLSADVGIVSGDSCTYIYDVGSDFANAEYINAIEGRKQIVLSHFHKDHSDNIPNIDCNEIYGGKATLKYFPQIIKVETTIEISDGINIKIFPLPSSHAKGSLGLMVNDSYIFVGDAIYPAYRADKRVYNVNLLKDEIELLESLPGEYILTSHREKFVNSKSSIIKYLKKIFDAKESGNPYIEWKY